MAGNRDDLQTDAAKLKDLIIFQGHQSAGLQSAALEFLPYREPEELIMQLEVSWMHPGFLKKDIAVNMIDMPVGVHDGDRKFGQLSDDHASQLGRIGNRLIRIVEHLPESGTVALARVSGDHVQLAFEADGVPASRLHDIAVKLANWGGDARA